MSLRLHFTLNDKYLLQKSRPILLQSRSDLQRINFASLYKSIHFFNLRWMETVKWEWRTLHDDIRMLFTLCHVCQFRTSKVCYLVWSNVQFKNRQINFKTDNGWRKHAVRYKPNAAYSKFWVGDSHSADAEDSALSESQI